MIRFLSLFFFALLLTGHGVAQKKSKVPKPSMALADSLFTAGNFQAAIPVYVTVLKKPEDAKNAQPWNRLATSYFNLQDYANALAAYKQVQKINPRTPGFRFNMAKSYAATGDADNSFRLLDTASRAGFSNYKMLDGDPAFESVRKVAGYKEVRDRIYQAAYPCMTLPKAREFDFWLGDWDVYLTSNPSVKTGFNRITKASGSCVIVENWESTGAHNGMSLNYFDPSNNKWQQKWAGSSQDVQEFTDGEYSDGAMRFKWEKANPNGTKITGRLTFSNMEPGKVRQHSEQSTDEGKTWSTQYDFVYIRR